MNEEKTKTELFEALQKNANEKMALVIAERKARAERSAGVKDAQRPAAPPPDPPPAVAPPRGATPIPDRYKDKKKGR